MPQTVLRGVVTFRVTKNPAVVMAAITVTVGGSVTDFVHPLVDQNIALTAGSGAGRQMPVIRRALSGPALQTTTAAPLKLAVDPVRYSFKHRWTAEQ